MLGTGPLERRFGLEDCHVRAGLLFTRLGGYWILAGAAVLYAHAHNVSRRTRGTWLAQCAGKCVVSAVYSRNCEIMTLAKDAVRALLAVRRMAATRKLTAGQKIDVLRPKLAQKS